MLQTSRFFKVSLHASLLESIFENYGDIDIFVLQIPISLRTRSLDCTIIVLSCSIDLSALLKPHALGVSNMQLMK